MKTEKKKKIQNKETPKLTDLLNKHERYQHFYAIEREVASVLEKHHLDIIESLWLIEDLKMSLYEARKMQIEANRLTKNHEGLYL